MTAAERANARRASWSGEIVRPGTPKPALLADLSYEERLAHMAALVRRTWIAEGNEMPPPTPRAEWPSEIIDLADADRA